MKTYHYIVSGKVQGVGYRFCVGYKLKKLEMRGIIRNLDSGDVEIYLQGEEKKIKDCERYIKLGSPYGKVSNIKKEIVDIKEFSKFNIEY
ncbi:MULTISPECIES: acylphosphatase [Fusobacterium]|uniref:acylphosphatase n=1 Tax=Fusobacterium TaxID=848 RepID=UPI001477062D|nr:MULTISPECIES: acylphosphatase [Fusobacterium]NME35413.1 acylphosphatase [Fusobacterium sp. FSA-380-WT-3A]